MRKYIISLTACAALVCAAAPMARAQDVQIVVNAANAVSELPASAISDLFLKKIAKFPGGGAATPVDQAATAAPRASFSKSVLGRPVSAVATYWQQQIFGGGELPPAIKASDDEVVAFVKATPGGIGYVSAGASVAGVKVVAVK